MFFNGKINTFFINFDEYPYKINDSVKTNGRIKILTKPTPTISTMIHSTVPFIFDENNGYSKKSTKNSKNRENHENR